MTALARGVDVAADPEVERVYLCEDRLQRWARAGRAVVVDGRLVSVEPEHDFADLTSATLFCTVTCLELGLPPVRVRLRKGDTKSHYRAAQAHVAPDGAEIALASWGGARLVVLHELAHHLAHHRVIQQQAIQQRGGRGIAEPAHGPVFRASLVDLLKHVSLPKQAAELQRLFTDAGLTITPPTTPTAPIIQRTHRQGTTT